MNSKCLKRKAGVMTLIALMLINIFLTSAAFADGSSARYFEKRIEYDTSSSLMSLSSEKTYFVEMDITKDEPIDSNKYTPEEFNEIIEAGLTSIYCKSTGETEYELVSEPFAEVANGIYVPESVAEEEEPSWIAQAAIGMVKTIFHGLESLLRLTPTEELVFAMPINSDPNTLNATMPEKYLGMFPKEWENTVGEYRLAFQVFSMILIFLAVIRILFTKSVSMVNPIVRAQTIEDISFLFVAAFLIVGINPLIDFLIDLNVMIARYFGSINGGTQISAYHMAKNVGIMGVFVEIMFFVINLYLNVMYIVRGISIAILTMLSPLFVVSLAMGGKWRTIFSTWSKELTSNIFMQAYHAIALSFLIGMTAVSGELPVLTKIVVFASIIPITELFRSIVFTGKSSGMAAKFGLSSLAVAGAAAGAVAAGGIKMSSHDEESRSSGGSNRSFGGQNEPGEVNADPIDQVNFAERNQALQGNIHNAADENGLELAKNSILQGNATKQGAYASTVRQAAGAGKKLKEGASNRIPDRFKPAAATTAAVAKGTAKHSTTVAKKGAKALGHATAITTGVFTGKGVKAISEAAKDAKGFAVKSAGQVKGWHNAKMMEGHTVLGARKNADGSLNIDESLDSLKEHTGLQRADMFQEFNQQGKRVKYYREEYDADSPIAQHLLENSPHLSNRGLLHEANKSVDENGKGTISFKFSEKFIEDQGIVNAKTSSKHGYVSRTFKEGHSVGVNPEKGGSIDMYSDYGELKQGEA